MFEHFLDGDEELAAAIAANVEGGEAAVEVKPKREEDVLAAGLQFVQNLREMGE